jgi:hypothetical protein
VPGELITIPQYLADDLLDEGLVTEPVVWRGADVVSLVTLAADMTSAVTAVVVARESLAAVIRRLIHHASQSVEENAEIKIFVQFAEEGPVVAVETNNLSGRTRLEVKVQTAVRDGLDRLSAEVSSHDG